MYLVHNVEQIHQLLLTHLSLFKNKKKTIGGSI